MGPNWHIPPKFLLLAESTDVRGHCKPDTKTREGGKRPDQKVHLIFTVNLTECANTPLGPPPAPWVGSELEESTM